MRRALEFLKIHAESVLAGALFLVALGLFLFQIVSLFAPIVHEQHNWRQADVYSVAYAFHADGFDFFHPRIDFWRGPTGIVGMEAPVYPTLAHVAMYFFGAHPRAARIAGWLVFALAMALGARVLAVPSGEAEPAVRRIRAAGFLAAGILSPIGLGEFRQIQPDGTAVSLALASAALCLLYARTERKKWFALAIVLYTLAAITKSPVLVAGPALWMLTFADGPLSLRKMILRGLPFVVPLAAYFLWFRWAQHLTATYEQLNPYFNLTFESKEILGNLQNLDLYKHVFGFLIGSYAMSWVLFPVCVAGVILGFRAGDRRVAIPMLSWLIFGAFFVLCFAYRTTVHWYYAMVVFPPAAYFGGLGLSNLLELGRKPGATGTLSRIAAIFSVLALALTVAAGGAAVTGQAVPAADGAAFERTWFHSAGLMILGGALLIAVAAGIFLKPGWVERRRSIVQALVLAAGIASLPRAVHDVAEAFEWRSGHSEWFTFDERYAEMRRAVDSVSTRADMFLVDGYQPFYLYLIRRKGFAVDSGTVAGRGGLGYYLQRGMRFYLHHAENPAVEPARRGRTPLARGTNFELYCIDPKGCGR